SASRRAPAISDRRRKQRRDRATRSATCWAPGLAAHHSWGFCDMSGGSGSKKKKAADEPAKEMATYQQAAFMPGFDTMIADQLAQGGYGSPDSLLAAFEPIFTPMTVPDM